MRDFSAVYKLPNVPAVYAFYSGDRGPKYVVYVGIAGKLKQRIVQHVIRRDSSVATGTSAINLNPDHIISLSWWEHPHFAETVKLKAAEIVAFEVLNPALRSRGAADKAGLELIANQSFNKAVKDLFEGPPTGTIEFYSIADAFEKIDELKRRLEKLERKIS